MKQPFNIDKMLLLEATDGGRDFFLFVLPDLKPRDSNSFENTLNPFYNDTKPGLSIYMPPDADRYFYKDFGEEDFQGDMYGFAALYYDLNLKTEFPLIMHRIAEDLNIPRKLIENTSFKPSVILQDKKYEFFYSGDTYGLEVAHKYFVQFGITQDVLREYGVRSLRQCLYCNTDGQLKTITARRNQLLIAYLTHTHAKIYSPDPKYFFHVGDKPTDFIFGLSQILLRNARYFTRKIESLKPRDVLIITGGEKDVLTLTSLGYDAICLNSETITKIDDEIVDGFFSSYDKIIVLYDNDDTGKKNSKKLAERYSLSVVGLPETLKDAGGKDISDYIQLGLDKAILHQLIAAAPDRNIYDVPPMMSQPAPEPSELSENHYLIPSSVYENLPDILKSMTGYFAANFERDLILLSVLATCSTLFPHVQGRYDRKKVGLNLFLFITARASAGKGVIGWAKVLTYKISDYLHEQHLRKYQKYQIDYSDYLDKRKSNPDTLPPMEPLEPRLLIPANTSCSMLIEILNNNRNFGLMFETEADALVSTIKSDWGDFSHILRAAFHHEPITLARRTNREYLEVKSPQLAGVFSGTLSSLKSFISGVENGFFSRFIQYLFDAPVEWKDKFNDDDIDLESIFEDYGDLFLNAWRKYDGADTIRISIQPEQRKRFFLYFETKLSQLYDANGDEIVASVNRHGLMAYRIAMVLTVLRQLSSGEELNKNIFINDVDFECALQITDVLFTHLEKVFSVLQNTDKAASLRTIKRRLYSNLPDNFTTREYYDIAIVQQVNTKTAEKYLGQLLAVGLLERLEQGKYRKK